MAKAKGLNQKSVPAPLHASGPGLRKQTNFVPDHQTRFLKNEEWFLPKLGTSACTHAGTNICRFPPSSSPLFHLMVLWFKWAACLYQDLGLRRTVGECRTAALLDLHVVLVDVFRTLHQSRSDVEAASPYPRFLGRG